MSSPTLSRSAPATRAVHASSAAPSRSAAGRAPAAPPPRARVAGRFRCDGLGTAWWWSPEMADILGLPTGGDPGIDALLRQQHPDDRSRIREALRVACADGRAFTLETRVVRSDGSMRSIVLTAEPLFDPAGGVRAVEGMCVDVSDCRPPGSHAERAEALQTEVAQLRAAMASRAAIEQAKGILMLLTGCTEQVAFDLLAHISSHTHRKVRDVAHSITDSASGHATLPDDVRAIIRDACPPPPR